jgi:rfaE bifunctional protein nucleotidyltransferase chain/domain
VCSSDLFTNGCFDILHRGHVAYLAQARTWCDRLIVGVNSDASVRALKGEGRPVNDLESRALVLAGLRSVDLVAPFDEATPLKLIEAARPDVLVKGADYAEDEVVGGDLVKSWGGQVRLAQIVDGYSTTAAIARMTRKGGPGVQHFPLLVAGIASEGYESGALREVVLSWPEFTQAWKALRPGAMAPSDPNAPAPAMGIVAEFVAESGKASGTVEIRTKSAGASERCETSRPNLLPRVAARLFQVRSGVAPLEIRADRAGVLRCESRQLGQRCLISVVSCGAEQTRIVWRAPAANEGPIWFSAGFVATDDLSSDPKGDSVTEIAVPMLSAESTGSQYTSALRNGCSVSDVEDRKSVV